MKKKIYNAPAATALTCNMKDSVLLDNSPLPADKKEHSDIDALSRSHGGWNSADWQSDGEE